MRSQTFEAIDDELKADLNDADAVLVDHRLIHWVTEYIEEDTRLFSTAAESMELALIDDGVIATQVNASALDRYDDVVSLWLEPDNGIVRAENSPDDS